MATRTALTDLSWNGKKFPIGKEFDDKGLPAAVLSQWEKERLCTESTQQVEPAKVVKETKHGS